MANGIFTGQPVGMTTPSGLPRLGGGSGVPSFEEIFRNLKFGGEEKFNLGLQTVTPTGGIRPETQGILDLIKQRQLEDEKRAVSTAQALAGRRGISGSSTEQFGTAQAAGEVAKSARDAEAQILLRNLEREQSLETLRANALFGRAEQEGNLGFQSGALGIQANQLLMEQAINERALQIAQENIGVSRDIAKEQAKNELLGTGIGAVTNLLGLGLLGRGGGGGGIPGFGGGGLPGLGNLFGSSQLTGAATGQFVPGIGMVGTGVPASPGLFGAGGSLLNTAGTGGGLGFGGIGLGLAGGLIGTQFGQKLFGQGHGQAAGSAVGGVAGGILGSFFGPLGTGAGSLIGSTVGAGVGKAVSSVAKSVKKVFPF